MSAKACRVFFSLFIALLIGVSTSSAQSGKFSAPPEVERAVLAKLDEIQKAAESLDPEKVFSDVAENDEGALVQNGRFFLTRGDALEATKQGFLGLRKVAYQFERQHISLISPTVALAVAQGTTTATIEDGRTFTNRFAQSVVLVLTDGEWKVFHAHRSLLQAE